MVKENQKINKWKTSEIWWKNKEKNEKIELDFIVLETIVKKSYKNNKWFDRKNLLT